MCCVTVHDVDWSSIFTTLLKTVSIVGPASIGGLLALSGVLYTQKKTHERELHLRRLEIAARMAEAGAAYGNSISFTELKAFDDIDTEHRVEMLRDTAEKLHNAQALTYQVKIYFGKDEYLAAWLIGKADKSGSVLDAVNLFVSLVGKMLADDESARQYHQKTLESLNCEKKLATAAILIDKKKKGNIPSV